MIMGNNSLQQKRTTLAAHKPTKKPAKKRPRITATMEETTNTTVELITPPYGFNRTKSLEATTDLVNTILSAGDSGSTPPAKSCRREQKHEHEDGWLSCVSDDEKSTHLNSILPHEAFSSTDFSDNVYPETQLVQALCTALSSRMMTTATGYEPNHLLVLPDKHHPLSIFFSSTKQSFGLYTYLERLVQYFDCSEAAFIVALVLVDRYIQSCKDDDRQQLLEMQYQDEDIEDDDDEIIRSRWQLNELNVHRIMSTAVVIATKMLDDEVAANDFYAKIAGVDGTEMNKLEIEFLKKIRFHLHVSVAEFKIYQQGMALEHVQCQRYK